MKLLLWSLILWGVSMCPCAQSRKYSVKIKPEKIDSEMTEGVTRFKRNLLENFDSIKMVKETIKSRIKRNNNQQNVRITTWSLWTACNVTTCGENGIKERSRSCFVAGIEVRTEGACGTKLVERRSCYVPCSETEDSAGIGFFQWSDWGSCSVTCGVGVRVRERHCGNSRPGSCVGPSSETKPCHTRYHCPQWGPWFPWGVCNFRCDQGGVRSRRRSCAKELNPSALSEAVHPKQIIPFPSTYGRISEPVPNSNCPGGIVSAIEFESCIIEGACNFTWSDWTDWSPCPVSCGASIIHSRRTCLAGNCVGNKWRYQICDYPPCWTEWSEFSPCSFAHCDQPGVRVRSRECSAHDGYSVYTMNECEGKKDESQSCSAEDCEGWGKWSRYSRCSRSCGEGSTTRTRRCVRGECPGNNTETVSCNTLPCPQWSSWSAYSCCTATCGESGIKERFRECLHQTGQLPGCPGSNREQVSCPDKISCNATVPAFFDSFECGRRRLNTTLQPLLKIFGGQESIEYDWPWQGSWQYNYCMGGECTWVHQCGATLVAPQWMITSGHCINETKYDINADDPSTDWSVQLGMHRLFEGGQRHYISDIFVHSTYNYSFVSYGDIALLKLRQPVTLSDEIHPICLPDLAPPVPGETCYITGWGYTEPSNNYGVQLSSVLQEAPVPILDFEACLNLTNDHRTYLRANDHFCAGDPITAATDSCVGDSGGPLMCNENNVWRVVGVTSFGFVPCGTPGQVGVYTPVNSFESWIRQTIEQNTQHPCL